LPETQSWTKIGADFELHAPGFDLFNKSNEKKRPKKCMGGRRNHTALTADLMLRSLRQHRERNLKI